MAKETQKEKIYRLENDLKQSYEIIQKLNNETSSIIEKSDDSFENSSTYIQMQKRIDYLELKIKSISDSSEHNRKMYENEIKINEKLNDEIQKLNNEEYTLEDIKELENRFKTAKNTSDKWHKLYYDENFKYKELYKNYNNLETKFKNLQEKNSKLKLDSEVLTEVFKEVKELKEENKQLKDNCISSLVVKKHNERRAGRKTKFTDEQITKIKKYRLDGKTIKDISEMYNCSVGLIHKIINEK